MVPGAQGIAKEDAEEAAEEVIVFGASVRLVGVVTAPRAKATATDAARHRIGVVLLNAGVVHRVGPNRLYVTLARRLAQSGFTVLRFDHAGVGDSDPRDDQLDFNQSSVAETIAAMDWLAAERRCESFVLIGLCSGTLTAFRTALADVRVTSLVLLTALLVDPSTVSEDAVAAMSERRVARSYLIEKIASPRAWRKAVAGKVDVRRVARVMRRFVAGGTNGDSASAKNPELVAELQRLLERGVSVRFVYADPTTVLEWFRTAIAPDVPRLRRHGRIDVSVVKQADHTFTQLRHQAQVIDLVSDWLARCT
jgi:pimeloyl-ACP methyl ester carboxylesterase